MVHTKKSQPRLSELEGLRGIAAIMVVLYHLLLLFYPGIMYGVGSQTAPVQHSNLESTVYGTPMMVFFSGNLAVMIFFVLSGFVLTVGFFQTGDVNIIRKIMAKRYLRLMLPALASVLLAWGCLRLGLSGVDSAAKITQSLWLEIQWNMPVVSIVDAMHQGVWDIFTNGKSYYNGVLWTMQL